MNEQRMNEMCLCGHTLLFHSLDTSACFCLIEEAEACKCEEFSSVASELSALRRNLGELSHYVWHRCPDIPENIHEIASENYRLRRWPGARNLPAPTQPSTPPRDDTEFNERTCEACGYLNRDHMHGCCPRGGVKPEPAPQTGTRGTGAEEE